MADADEHADERAAGNTDEGEQVAQPDPDETAGEVTTEENDILTAPFSEEEVRAAVFQMEHNKAPGPDGFPADVATRTKMDRSLCA